MSLWIRHARLVLPKAVQEGDCLVEGGKIAALGALDPPRKAQVLEAQGLFLSPGFVDLHVHGGGGGDLSLGDPEQAGKAVRFHTEFGTTSLVATLPPAPWDELERACAALGEVPGVLGVHLEGPFLSPAKSGALPERHLLAPTTEALQRFRQFLRKVGNVVRLVTLAPEVPGSADLIQEILEAGAVPALGHTDATYEQALQAVRRGAGLFTHLGNAMRGLHHREPGAVGAALESDTHVELICDGVHLHPAFVRLVARVKGFNRICLVTDAIPAAGLPEGPYGWGERTVELHKDRACLPNATLAGSALTLNQAVKNFAQFTGCSMPQAVRCATLNPARLLGRACRKGSLAVGKDADLVLMDEDFAVHLVVRGGKIAYWRDDATSG